MKEHLNNCILVFFSVTDEELQRSVLVIQVLNVDGFSSASLKEELIASLGLACMLTDHHQCSNTSQNFVLEINVNTSRDTSFIDLNFGFIGNTVTTVVIEFLKNVAAALDINPVDVLTSKGVKALLEFITLSLHSFFHCIFLVKLFWVCIREILVCLLLTGNHNKVQHFV